MKSEIILNVMAKSPIKTITLIIVLIITPILFTMDIKYMCENEFKSIRTDKELGIGETGQKYYIIDKSGGPELKKVSKGHTIDESGNFYLEEDYKASFIIFVILDSISLIILLTGTFSTDTSVNWEYRSIKIKYIKKHLKKHTEKGYDYYYYNGKLLAKVKEGSHIHIYDIINKYMETPNLLDDYLPKNEYRKSRINKALKVK